MQREEDSTCHLTQSLQPLVVTSTIAQVLPEASEEPSYHNIPHEATPHLNTRVDAGQLTMKMSPYHFAHTEVITTMSTTSPTLTDVDCVSVPVESISNLRRRSNLCNKDNQSTRSTAINALFI